MSQKVSISSHENVLNIWKIQPPGSKVGADEQSAFLVNITSEFSEGFLPSCTVHLSVIAQAQEPRLRQEVLCGTTRLNGVAEHLSIENMDC